MNHSGLDVSTVALDVSEVCLACEGKLIEKCLDMCNSSENLDQCLEGRFMDTPPSKKAELTILCRWNGEQSSREAGQALMKSGLRLKGGLTVIVRSLDQRQRKQLLLDTISKSGTNAALGGSSSSSSSSSFSYLPRSSGPVDIDAPAADEQPPPKSSVSKFVDLVFGTYRLPHLQLFQIAS